LSGPGTELTARAELAAKCRSCGTCRSVCPVFAEVGTEDSVARGKVTLIRSVLDGELDLSEIFEDRVLLCLNCKTCVANCPNGVPVADLILAARHDLVESGRLPIVRRLVFRSLLKRGRLLPPFGRLASFAQRWLLRGLPQGSPLRILLPLAGVDEHRVFPDFAPRSFMADAPLEARRLSDAASGRTSVAEPAGEAVEQEVGTAVGGTSIAWSTVDQQEAADPTFDSTGAARVRVARSARRVAYFVGCATNIIYPESGRATVDALTRSGVDVVIPRDQGCCGAPVFNSGDYETARDMARHNIRVLRDAGVDAVVTGCASCGLTLKREYEETLGLAGGVGLPVFDLTEFLALRGLPRRGLASEAPSPARRVRVTYHDACHLVRGQKVSEEPRELLRSLPWVEFVEMRDADRCCGGGGTFSLSHYDISKRIGERKVAAIRDADVDVVATECPVCVMQLRDVLEQAGVNVAVLNVADVLALGRAGND